MRPARWLSLAAVVASLASSGSARAQGRDPVAGEALFREGRAASEAGDHAKACAKFRESNRLDPAPGTIFNLADCEEKLGRLATAWTLFREVSQKLSAQDDRHAIATSRAAALEPRLPKLTIAVSAGTPPSARVFRDGVELQAGALDTPLPVDPGVHVIALDVPGHARVERRVELAEAESKRETLQPGPAGPATDGDDAVGDGGSTRRTLGWVALGVGFAGLAAGGITGVLVLDKKSVVDENCDAAKRCNPQGIEAADAGRTLGTVSAVGLIAGAAVAGAGLVLVLTSDSGGESSTAWSVGPGSMWMTKRF
jgi:hypothetical protein